MVQIKFEELEEIREKFKDKNIVFCSGSFDLTHVGHILFLEDCKKLGDILVVSIGGDSLLKKRKSDSRPILNEKIRLKTIDSLKPVDYCFIEPPFNTSDTLLGLEETFKLLKPNFYVINKDASNIEYRKILCKKYNTNLFILERHCPSEFENISTTKIINKILSLKDN
jgi:cytidyltransferase-like protein